MVDIPRPDQPITERDKILDPHFLWNFSTERHVAAFSQSGYQGTAITNPVRIGPTTTIMGLLAENKMYVTTACCAQKMLNI